jgi:hypothetical protein
LEGANIIPFRCIWWRKTLVSLSLRAKTIGKKIQFFLVRRHFTLCKYCDNPPTAPEDILSQPLWLNSEIKIGGKPVLYQHWANADVFFINDLLKNEGGFLSLEQFPNKYGIISNFLEYLYNGLLKAIPMKFKEVIAVNNKLEKVCDRYVTVLNNTLKPTKPFYKMMLEKHNVHPTKSQEKWQIRLEK